jgi:putative MFS transporter
MRGRLIVILEAFWAVGWTAAALIGFLVIPGSDDGWRWAFALGAIPAAYALVVRWGLPESARWLRPARAVSPRRMQSFGRSRNPPAVVEPPDIEVRPDTAPAAAESARERLAALWSAEFRVRTACLWLVWFCVNFSYYGAFIWIPSILVSQGYDLVRSFGFTLIITLAQLPGYAVAAWLIEVWGTPAHPVGLPRGLGGLGHPLRYGGPRSPRSSPPAWRCRSSTWVRGGALYAVTPEMYPHLAARDGFGVGSRNRSPRLDRCSADRSASARGGGAPASVRRFAAFFAIAAGAAWGCSTAADGPRRPLRGP